jgi:hypothetical protein
MAEWQNGGMAEWRNGGLQVGYVCTLHPVGGPEVQIVVELGNLVPRKFLGPQKISQRVSLSVTEGLNENLSGFL